MAEIVTPGTSTVTVPRRHDDDDLDHYYCCDENLAICGRDLTGVPIVNEEDGFWCVVCDDPETPSAGCGCIG